MIHYTKKDMQILHDMSAEGSPARVYTEETKYSPSKFKEILQGFGLSRDINYLFEMPLDEVPLLINKGNVSGYLKFRMQVGK